MQLSTWALWRGQTAGTGSLASGGTLGGSQAGARLTYAFDRRIAASLRSSSARSAGAGRGTRRRRSHHADPVDPSVDYRRKATGDRPIQHRPLGLCFVRGGGN